MLNLLVHYFCKQLNIINENLHEINNPGYRYFFLVILIKLCKSYINDQFN